VVAVAAAANGEAANGEAANEEDTAALNAAGAQTAAGAHGNRLAAFKILFHTALAEYPLFRRFFRRHLTRSRWGNTSNRALTDLGAGRLHVYESISFQARFAC
jgi:hypothetical protein